MAKRYDNDFDAEGFVENFRAKDEPPAPRTPKEKQQPVTEEQDRVADRKEKTATERSERQKPTDSADDYKAAYIDDLKYRFPEYGWPQVKINPAFCSRIANLEILCGNRRANLSTFINNVLERHFRDCEAQIKELKKKYNDNE